MLKHDRIHYRNQTHNMLHTLLYFLALFSLSTSANWAKLSTMPVDVLGFYRLGLAAVLLGLWLFFIKRLKWPKLDKKVLWIVLSGFFFFLHLWTFKYAAKNTTISNSMIIFSSNPIWASVGAVLFFNEKLNFRLFAAYILAFLGVYVLVAPGFQTGHQLNSGDISSFFSAILYALYMLTGKKARTYFENKFYALIQYAVCGLCFFALTQWNQTPLTGFSNLTWFALFGLIALPTFFGHFSLTYLVQYMNLSVMTCGKLIEPIMASIIAAYVFNEHLSETAPFAFTLTSAAVIVLFSPNLISLVKNKFNVSNVK
jgi:drug/metabolite transporter (DMT)-like permease